MMEDILEVLNEIFPRDVSKIIQKYTLFGGIITKHDYIRDIYLQKFKVPLHKFHITRLIEHENKLILADNFGRIVIFENIIFKDIIYDKSYNLQHVILSPNEDIVTCSKGVFEMPTIKVWRHKNKMSNYKYFINVLRNPIKYYQNYNENYKCIYTIFTNEIYPNNMLLINNNNIIFTDYPKKDIQVHRDNKLLYTLSSNTKFSSILSLHNDNLVTGTCTGSIKIWKENICIDSFDTISKTKIIKISELLDKNLLILDESGNIYIWSENRLIATLNHNGCYDIITLSNNDFITKSLHCFQIWKKEYNKYICIQEETSNILCLMNIKAFENDFISWVNTYEYNELFGNEINIWKYDKKMNIYINSTIKHERVDDINNVFVIPSSNKLVIVYTNGDMTILE